MIKTKQQYLNAQRLIRKVLSDLIWNVIYARLKLKTYRFMNKESKDKCLEAVSSHKRSVLAEIQCLYTYNSEWLSKREINAFIGLIDFKRMRDGIIKDLKESESYFYDCQDFESECSLQSQNQCGPSYNDFSDYE